MDVRYVIKKIGYGLLTIFITVSITFVLYRLLPGGPVETLRRRLILQSQTGQSSLTLAQINRRVELLTGIRPDQPLHIQYINYMIDVFIHQDFGESLWLDQPVMEVLFEAMPWSVFISMYGLLLGFVSNVLLGSVMAYRQGSRFDKAMSAVATTSLSVPYYVVAIFMLSVLAFQLEWFPTGGRYNSKLSEGVNFEFMASVLHHAALPIISSFVVGFGGGALSLRGNCIRVMGDNYVRSARIRGIGSTRIAVRYVAQNAFLPMYTKILIGLSSVFSSSVILERIFQYPGVGWYTFDALESRDYPLLMGVLFFFTTVTVIGILIADFTYGLIDPRAETRDEGLN